MLSGTITLKSLQPKRQPLQYKNFDDYYNGSAAMFEQMASCFINVSPRGIAWELWQLNRVATSAQKALSEFDWSSLSRSLSKPVSWNQPAPNPIDDIKAALKR